MEFVPTRRNRKCKKKRHWRKRLRDQIRVEVEVRSSKHRKITPGHANTFVVRGPSTSTMQADAFWKNYTAAQDWQTKHNVTWWRSRCMALEHENEILRNKIRSLLNQSDCPDIMLAKANYHEENTNEEQEEAAYNEEAEELEFTVTEEMLRFFEKSERHRREMKQKHKSDKAKCKKESVEGNLITDGAASARARKEEANELYGDASSKILAMETALQATLDNYKDKVKPQFWPNIPLKP
ncbi:PREDICTED: gem-associated protein 8-like [Dinoponera quadriceps]|uniref:Gem-associated protein 8-like n=1 Tax=Dinoponera quadriceps TaxID=609295 RepID=A0A6P3WRD8_DINQU|nr:PREDICTED: gem-associated protein 8-like [Dinoponera quadriceps]